MWTHQIPNLSFYEMGFSTPPPTSLYRLSKGLLIFRKKITKPFVGPWKKLADCLPISLYENSYQKTHIACTGNICTHAKPQFLKALPCSFLFGKNLSELMLNLPVKSWGTILGVWGPLCTTERPQFLHFSNGVVHGSLEVLFSLLNSIPRIHCPTALFFFHSSITSKQF